MPRSLSPWGFPRRPLSPVPPSPVPATLDASSALANQRATNGKDVPLEKSAPSANGSSRWSSTASVSQPSSDGSAIGASSGTGGDDRPRESTGAGSLPNPSVVGDEGPLPPPPPPPPPPPDAAAPSERSARRLGSRPGLSRGSSRQYGGGSGDGGVAAPDGLTLSAMTIVQADDPVDARDHEADASRSMRSRSSDRSSWGSTRSSRASKAAAGKRRLSALELLEDRNIAGASQVRLGVSRWCRESVCSFPASRPCLLACFLWPFLSLCLVASVRKGSKGQPTTCPPS